MAHEIAVGIAVYAAALKEKRKRDEEREKQYAEERRLREISQRRTYVEKRRKEELDAVLLDLEKLERLRALIASLQTELTAETDGRVAEFVRWTDHHLKQAEGRISAQGLEERFEAQRIFGSDDDYGFYPSHW